MQGYINIDITKGSPTVHSGETTPKYSLLHGLESNGVLDLGNLLIIGYSTASVTS